MHQDVFNKNMPWILFPLSSAQFFADEKFAALSDSRVPGRLKCAQNTRRSPGNAKLLQSKERLLR